MPYKDKEQHRLYRLARTAKHTEFLRAYKVERGCADCGWNGHHAGLEFDHLSDKTANISCMRNYSMKRILEEVAKCEVVCGTCHNLRTFKRKGVE